MSVLYVSQVRIYRGLLSTPLVDCRVHEDYKEARRTPRAMVGSSRCYASRRMWDALYGVKLWYGSSSSMLAMGRSTQCVFARLCACTVADRCARYTNIIIGSTSNSQTNYWYHQAPSIDQCCIGHEAHRVTSRVWCVQSSPANTSI